DDHFLNAPEGVFTGGEKVGDDAGHTAAVIEHGGRQCTHQSDRAAAIDKADAVLGEYFSQGNGGFDKAGVCAGAGAAIDTDGLDFVHVGHVALQRKSVKSGGFADPAESIGKCQ